MADEQLRLVAGLKDNATPGIRRINSELKTIRVNPGMEQAQKWVRAFGQDVALFKQSSMTIASVMSAMGIGGLAAAGSIGSLAAAFKKLAEHTLDVRELGREVGLTADEINAMNRAGQHFGIDPSVMQGAIKHLAGLMPEFKRGYGELNSVLARQPDLIKRLRVEDTKAQIKDLMGFLDTIKNPQDRMVFDRAIFGTDEMEKAFADGAGGFEAQAEKFRRTLAPVTEAAAAQAQALRDAINDFNAAVDNLEMKAGPTVYRWLTAGVTKLEEVLEKVQRHPGDAVALGGVGAGAAATMLLRRRIMAGSALAGGTEMRAAAGQLSAAGSGMDKAAVTLNEAAIALREAAVELRGRGGVGGTPGSKTADEAPPSGGSFDKGRALLAAAGLAGVVVNAPGMDEAGDRERDANAAGLASLGELLKKWTGAGWLENKFGGGGAGSGGFRVPDAYNREMRARGGDGQDHTLDGVVVGSLERPILHLSNTLKTASSVVDGNVRPAAFHPGGIISAAGADPVALLAAGVKQGMLEAMREWAGGASSADPSTARAGIMPASFGGGGGGGGNRVLGGGGFGSANLAGGDAQGAEADRIRDLAKKYGIDPRVAVAVAKSEGLGVAWGSGMDHGTSFGAFQLHVGGGLGDRYQRETGHDPRDQANAAEMDDWALKYASKHGWGDWHGAARIGVRGMAGIGGRPTGNADLGPGDVPGKVTGINPVLKDMVKRAGEIMGTQLSVYSGLRSPEHNRAVGGAEHSLHMRGLAADLTAAGHPKNDRAFWERVNGAMGQASREFNQHYRWGGGFGGRFAHDNDHFDLTAGGASAAAMAKHKEMMEQGAAPLRDAAEKLRGAAADQSRAASVVARAPEWHRSDQQERPDLGAEKRKLEMRDRDAAKVEGGIDAHIHLHDNRTNTRVERRGVVRDSSITVRRAPQRTYTV